jgi:COP9 signalosome complex subunit 6
VDQPGHFWATSSQSHHNSPPVRQVFKDFDFLGWYSTGPEPTAAEIYVHEQFATFNESPLYVQLFPNMVATSRELPIAVYESLIDLVDGRAQTMFVRSQYRVETMEAERIAVNHVAKAAAADASEGSGGETPLFYRCRFRVYSHKLL